MAVYPGSITKIKHIYQGNRQLKHGYQGNKLFYSAGNIVRYHISSNLVLSEEVDEGASVLSPKTFVPSTVVSEELPGWIFVGWRTDATANATVLTEKVMVGDPIDLYAVCKQVVTVTYYNGSTTASKQSKDYIYNNGNTLAPTFALPQASVSGWTARGWSTNSGAVGAISFNNGASFTRTANITLYGMYHKTVTLSYAGNGNTSGSTASQSGTAYWNSGSGNKQGASIALRANGFTKSYHNFSGWLIPGQGTLAAGKTIAITANTTATAVWTAVATYLVSGGMFNVNYSRSSLPSADEGNSKKYRSSVNTSNATSLGYLPDGAKPVLYINGSGQDNFEVVSYIEWDIPSGFRYYRVDACVSAAAVAGAYQSAKYKMNIINANTGVVVAQSSDLGWHGYKLEAVDQFDGSGDSYVPGAGKYTADIVDLGSPASYPVRLRIILAGGFTTKGNTQESRVIFPTVRIYN